MNIKSTNYDDILLDSLKVLPSLPSKSGQEGTAYFLDDKYVIKSYTGSMAVVMRQNIEPYIQEINSFIQNSGIKLPKIYSFIYKPGGIGGVDFTFGSNLYLLIERVPGTALFLAEKDLFADICKKKASADIYNMQNINFATGGIGKDKQTAQLLFDILCTLNEYYTEATKKLINLPQGKMQEVLSGVAHMMVKGKYTMPDFNGGNTLTNGQDVRLIDPISVSPNSITTKNRTDSTAKYIFMRSIVLFEDFAKMFGYQNALKNYQKDGLVTSGQVEHVEKMFKDSKDVLMQGLEYMLLQCKQSLDGRKMTREQFEDVKHKLADTLGNAFENGDAMVNSMLNKVSPNVGR